MLDGGAAGCVRLQGERERVAAIKRGEMESAAGVVGIGERIKGEISY